MPDLGIQPPYLDPSQYPAYLDLQKKQMLAQALGQAAQQTSQTPAEWNSMRVVPRKSALSSVAALATALGAGAMQKQAFGAQQQYMQGLFGGQPGSPSAAPPAAAPKPGVAPLTADMPPRAGVVAPQQAPPPTGNQNMLLTGEPRTSQQLLSMMGPQEYAKALAGRYAPTDMEKMLRAAGIDPASPQGQQALIQNVNKQNYIAPVQAREGSTLVGPDGKPTFYNPKVAAGALPQFGANGMPTGVTEIPGAAAAAEDAAKATELGQTAGKYSILPTGGGGSTVVGGPINQGAPGARPSAFGRPAPRVGQSSSQPPPPAGLEGMPKLPVSTAIGAPDAFTEGTLKASGAKHAELASQYGKEADLADQKMQYNTDARAVISNAETGPNSEWLTENRSKLLEWGVPESLVPGSEKVTPTLELNKVLKQSALQGARQIFGSRMTQNEVQLQHQELSPSPSMTRDAILSLMHQDDIKQMYAKQRSDDYGRYIESKGDPMRFESWYSKTHPLTAFAKQHAADPATTPATPTPQQSAPVTKQIGGKTYIQQNGKWFEQ